jgi:hypothetical protein
VNTLEERLRAATRAAARTVYADSAPPLRLPARPMHNRVPPRWHGWRRWLAPAAAAASVIAVVAGLVAIGGRTHGRHVPGHAGAAAFPGGGRILFADAAQGLKWLYPNGKTTEVVGRGFAGGQVNSAGTALLARQASAVPGAADQDYYLAGPGRSGARLILPAEPGVGRTSISHLDVQVSPGGSDLAWIREADLPNGKAVSDQLRTLNLATGARADLGPVPSGTAFAWLDSSAIVTQSADLRSLVSVNVTTGSRSQLMSVGNRGLARAFDRVRPGAGPPARITPLGASLVAGRPVLAVDLAAAARNGVAIDHAVAFLTGGTVRAYAVGGMRAYQSLTWGPDGYFAILTTTSPPGCPPLNGAAYVGNVSAGHLARVPNTGKNLIVGGAPIGSAFSPSGRYLAVDHQGLLAFTPTPTIGSLRTGSGYPAHLITTIQGLEGTLQGWAPSSPSPFRPHNA